MNNQTLATDILSYGLRKYGEFTLINNDFEGLPQSHYVTDYMSSKGILLLRLMEAILPNGDILEENLEKQFYIATVRTGKIKATRALVAMVLCADTLQFAAYAREGFIKQNLAQKAIDSIKNSLKS